MWHRLLSSQQGTLHLSLYKVSLLGTIAVEGLQLYWKWRNYQQTKVTTAPLGADVRPDDFVAYKAYRLDSMWSGLLAEVGTQAWNLVATLFQLDSKLYAAIGSRWTRLVQAGDGQRFTRLGSLTHAVAVIAIKDLLETLLNFPFVYYENVAVEGKHGGGHLTRAEFVLDQCFGCVRRVCVSALLIEFVQGLAQCSGPSFPWYCTLATAFGNILVRVVLPAYRSRLHLQSLDLDQAPLTVVPSGSTLYTKLHTVVGGTSLKDILVCSEERTRAMAENASSSLAHLVGFGTERRLVICETLLQHLSEDEVVAVVARGVLPYQQAQETFTSAFFSTMRVALASFGVRALWYQPSLARSFGFTDSNACIAYLVLLQVGTVGSELCNAAQVWWSRRCVFRADAKAVEMGFGDALSRALMKLNKAADMPVIVPSDWLWSMWNLTEPEVQERLEAMSKLKPPPHPLICSER